MGSRWGWHNRPRRVAGVDWSMISIVIVIVYIDSTTPQSQPTPQTGRTVHIMIVIILWCVWGHQTVVQHSESSECSVVSPLSVVSPVSAA